VPTRDPVTGETTKSFVERFTERRQATLPPGVPRERFPDYYRLTINTRVASPEPVTIRVGDAVMAV
ncbi:MAG: MOSC domain-containing protein, partial [Candidatus Zixiibacteriota bacterium]